ncbi:hypothetical protein ACRAWD_30920 [Caulobacter segnis]
MTLESVAVGRGEDADLAGAVGAGVEDEVAEDLADENRIAAPREPQAGGRGAPGFPLRGESAGGSSTPDRGQQSDEIGLALGRGGSSERAKARNCDRT